MSASVVFTRAARDEMDSAYRWYEQQRAGLGSEFVTAVRATVEAVAERPQRFAIVHRDIRRALLRRFPYAIYFRSTPSRIEIIAVYHGHRDPRGWRRRP